MKPAQKRKALFVILAVTALTLYNILPTLFFYGNNLNAPITKSKALQESRKIANRVNNIEKESKDWIYSYCKLLKVSPSKIIFKKKTPELMSVSFPTEKQARTFKTHMQRAGNLIPFFPNRIVPLEVNSTRVNTDLVDNKVVVLKREVPVHFDQKDPSKYFAFVEMYDKDGALTNEYKLTLENKIYGVAKAAIAPSKAAVNVELSMGEPAPSRKVPFFLEIANTIISYDKIFKNNKDLRDQFFARVFHSKNYSTKELYQKAIAGLQSAKDSIVTKKIALQEKIEKEHLDANDRSIFEVSSLQTHLRQEKTLLAGLTLLQNNQSAFTKIANFTTNEELRSNLKNGSIENGNNFSVDTHQNNAVITGLKIDYKAQKVEVEINQNLLDFAKTKSLKEQQKINGLIYDQIALLKSETGEEIKKNGLEFHINLAGLEGAKSILTLNLKEVAKTRMSSIKSVLSDYWKRESDTLSQKNYEIISWNDFQSLPEKDKHFKLTVYSPVLEKGEAPSGFHKNSIYIIGKDLLLLYENLTTQNQMEEGSAVQEDLMALSALLNQYGARTYMGSSYPFDKEFKADLIFEVPDYAASLIQATRENFEIGSGATVAALELSDVRNRILTQNKIEDDEHKALLQWKDDYNSSIANPKSEGHMFIPAPTKSTFLNNIALSTKKYFRGDERKILHFGMDMTGGRTVRVALKNKQNKVVTKEADLSQGINELYRRVNKMGVSDVTIRREGSHISLDFPASQSLSASELITSSSMTFHIVNEKFSYYNKDVANPLNRFLQEVWNEALVTGKTDAQSINRIAFAHLYGDKEDGKALARSDAGRALIDQGLELADPDATEISSNFNDTISKIGVLEGKSYKDWFGAANPLVVLMNNYALEGASLKEVNSGYDPTSGNYLAFTIRSSIKGESGAIEDPRETLYNWTSVFATSQLTDEKYASYTGGQGWRLAAILNGRIISMPRLGDALKDSGRITGSFTQKEVARLAADLRAGSLTYTPEIISEESISPDLGQQERSQGIFATGVAFLAVISLMVFYYRFAGVIASVAVVFNILIIWAVLQNLGASLTLPGIAGIILTIGMAVDANVLIFERIREEQEAHGDLGRAISEGYKKAFTAIFDSNITTIIAALILLNFDAGPVKGFALTLIIGIVSSMFTALYMTRTFFNYWYKRGKEQSLKMLNLIPNTGISFMKYGKIATIASVVMMVIGGITLFEQRSTLFGMDFTGGMTLQVEVDGSKDPKLAVENALANAGIASSEYNIRTLKESGALKIYLSNSLNNPGRPFADLQRVSDMHDVTYSFEKNAKLSKFVQILHASGVELTQHSKEILDKNFTNISGQMSDTMRNNAIIGLVLALIAILIYITIRFEFTYAISATIGLAFDLVLTLAVLGICKAFGLPLSIDLNTVAALMTIIGYSLNDTIIVFDRIRSDLKVKKTTTFKDIINLSLNKTLSRTIMTSLTTLVVLLSLVILGGKSIFNFSFLMMMGVIIGTLSTLFIASTFLLLFRGSKKTKKHQSAKIVSIS